MDIMAFRESASIFSGLLSEVVGDAGCIDAVACLAVLSILLSEAVCEGD